VDALTPDGRLESATAERVGDFFATVQGRTEELLRQTSSLLATMTSHTALVVGPKAEVATVRTVQVVRLSARTATVVAVLSNGDVESESISLADGIEDHHLESAATHLAAHLVGRALAGLEAMPLTNDVHVDVVCASAFASLRGHLEDEPVFVGGAAALAQSFDAVEVVRNVLQTLEQEYVVVSLVRDILDRGLSVAIGAEHGVEPLAACSVVVAPVVSDGEVLGSVGVLGPTRMNYPQALATVEVVGEKLGRRLTDGN
jgi:heat-inducible transcriptional repressor